VGWEKVACWSTKVAISVKCVKIEGKMLWRAYRKSPTLFQMVPSATPYDLFSPKLGASRGHLCDSTAFLTGLADLRVEMIHLTFVCRSLKGRCSGNNRLNWLTQPLLIALGFQIEESNPDVKRLNGDDQYTSAHWHRYPASHTTSCPSAHRFHGMKT